MVPKKKEKSQKYQTKFSHIFLEAFLSKTSKNQPQRNFTNLFKSEIFFMVREKSKGKWERNKKSESMFTLIYNSTRDTS